MKHSPKKKPGRPAKPWPEKIPDTPENVARVLMRPPLKVEETKEKETEGV